MGYGGSAPVATQNNRTLKMPKHQDRHLGKRENIWFPFDEHAAMLKGMEAIKESNKSVFIRTAVRNFIKALKTKGAM